jgi:hypothetical protein
MKRHPGLGSRLIRLLLVCVASAALPRPAAAAEAVFPLASPIGLVPPPGLAPSQTFQGFEDRGNEVFVRLVALPSGAFADIEKTMTNEALRKQGMTVETRESLKLPSGRAMLLSTRQQAGAVRLQKWLLIAPFKDLTALVSFELPSKGIALYPETRIRTALATVTVRAEVPNEEKLALLPFNLSDLAGMRLVRVVPGVAAQLTDGPQDSVDAYGQAHLIITAASGGPQEPRERDQFARLALSGLPPLKEVRIASAEPMRIGGQPGYEVRAEGKSPQGDTDVSIVQWLRFGTGAYLRILGITPKQHWTENFTRFRAVRDGLEPR